MPLRDDPSYRWESRRSALVIAHPGHELRLYHWVERARPLVLVLTDGSGHTDHSRLASTTAVLSKANATPGSLYGRTSDRELYEAILAQNADFFLTLTDEIARILHEQGIEYVVGDAVEGVNPGHDMCRLVLNAALLRIEQTAGRRVRNFEFPVEGPPYEHSDNESEGVRLVLDDDAYRRKLTAAKNYTELAVDLERIVSTHGEQMFRIEYLRPVRYGLEIGQLFEHPAIYERYGERQVAAGLYQEVIRFREHISPLAKRLAPSKPQ